MKLRIALIGMLICCTSVSFAEGVAVEPGKWEMTMTMEMSMLPAPQTRTSTECIEQDELSPEDFNMDEDSPCNISDMVIDGNTVSWAINCPGPTGGEMTGSWSFTSHGDSITGEGSMTAEMAGQSMEFKMNWGGKRVGDCE
jgi:hypothetical protein